MTDWSPSCLVFPPLPTSTHGYPQVPQAELDPEFVYGYAGMAETAANLYLTSKGHHVYYVAGIAIVYDKATHSQRFFRGHDDDLSSMALCEASVYVNNVKKERGTLVVCRTTPPFFPFLWLHSTVPQIMAPPNNPLNNAPNNHSTTAHPDRCV